MLILFILFISGTLLEKYLLQKFHHNFKLIRNFQLIFSFIFAIIIYAVFTWQDTNMISWSGDAADIWNTITSFHTDNVYGSYVLYKGINSVYPYVWLYDLSQFFNVNEWFFIRIFYAGAFAYISSIGFPNMVELLVQQRAKLYRRCLCSILMWYFWYYSMAFTQLMIDLPCLMYYILLINTALRLFRIKERKRSHMILYLWAGILCGLCMTASGQYTTPAVCIIIFLFLTIIKNNISLQRDIRSSILYFILFLSGLILIIVWNSCFEKFIVNSLRQNGAWIPSGSGWLYAGLARFRENYRSGGGAISIPSHRNNAILMSYFGEYLPGLNGLNIYEYLKVFLKYPFDFILNYINSFFLILSPDHGRFNLFPLLIFYSLLYCSLYIGINKCKKWKQFFSPLFWIGFSFLWATVPMLVMNIEPRTCMQIQGLIMALAVCDDTIWRIITDYTKSSLKIGLIKTVKHTNISYPLIFYLVFVCFCILHISTLYETIGSIPADILINIK